MENEFKILIFLILIFFLPIQTVSGQSNTITGTLELTPNISRQEINLGAYLGNINPITFYCFSFKNSTSDLTVQIKNITFVYEYSLKPGNSINTTISFHNTFSSNIILIFEIKSTSFHKASGVYSFTSVKKKSPSSTLYLGFINTNENWILSLAVLMGGIFPLGVLVLILLGLSRKFR